MQYVNHAHRVKPYNGPNPLLWPFPAPMSWKQDGEDHINIGRHAATELGRLLESDSPISFNHSIFGKFSNVQSFAFYIQSAERDDRLRKLRGVKLYELANTLTRVTIPNLDAIILDAMYQRIYQNDDLFELFTKSTLPFECYKDNKSGIRIRPEYFDWLIRGLSEIRAAIKENRDADFKWFRKQQAGNLFYGVIK